MDREHIVHSVCEFLSIPDMVWLGCCCQRLAGLCQSRMGLKMQAWNDSLEEARVLKLEAMARQMTSSFEEKELEIEKEFEKDGDEELHTSGLEYLAWRREQSEISHREESKRPLGESIETLRWKITSMAIAQYGEGLDRYFKVRNASQGGPIFITGLHFAAMTGDLLLCRLLLTRGASVNHNIFIPNDQDSNDKSEQAANCDNGYDWSQYRWGLITPLRMAITFGSNEVVNALKECNGKAGKAYVTSIPKPTLVSLVSLMSGGHRFPSLPEEGCWTNEAGTEMMYLNTYMYGERTYPNLLFERGVDFTS